MSTYEPGTVAVATVRGTHNVRVIRSACEGWSSVRLVFGSLWHEDSDVTDVRPLVVLDLDDPKRFYADLGAAIEATGNGAVSGRLRRVAEQIEAQTKPPRIPEPGLWGVVEAHTGGNSDRRQFGRVPESDDQHWLEADAMGWFLWSELVDPVLVRDGIKDGES